MDGKLEIQHDNPDVSTLWEDTLTIQGNVKAEEPRRSPFKLDGIGERQKK